MLTIGTLNDRDVLNHRDKNVPMVIPVIKRPSYRFVPLVILLLSVVPGEFESA
jgi:hypothetical protein